MVIIGGGFGGLCAARGLVGAPVSVTLIDKRNYHLFRPMLYQVATGLLSADQISRPLRSILSRQANVEVLMDEVSGVDTDKRLVRLKQHSISYDYLVLATGIQYNYFGHDEWRRVAPGLESLDDADLIRGKILLAFERAEEMAALDHADTESIRQLPVIPNGAPEKRFSFRVVILDCRGKRFSNRKGKRRHEKKIVRRRACCERGHDCSSEPRKR